MDQLGGGAYTPSFEKNKDLPNIYHQSYKWFRSGAGWILREEWYLVNPDSKSLQQQLLAFREQFYLSKWAQ
jgi:hypothetical protein